MTTGSVGPSIGTVMDPYFTGVNFSRNWSGDNGKEETYAGGKRTKWNNYTTAVASRLRPTNLVGWYRYLGSPSAGLQYMGQTYAVGVSWNGFGAEPTWTTADTNKLYSKLLEKVKGHDFNLAVNLAQMNQVSSMVALNLGQFGRSIMALKHGDFATAARCLGVKPKASRLKATDISGRWLELQYGWLPTLSDTFEAAKAFEALSQGPRSSIIRTSRVIKGSYEGSVSPSIYSCPYELRLSRRIIYQMYEEMSFDRQLGLQDPLTVAWEIIPYSFVVDWFVPIGTYLENLNAIPKLRGRFLTTTTTRREGFGQLTGKLQLPFSAFSLAKVNGRNSDTDRARQTNMTRQITTSLSPPLPSFNLSGSLHGHRIQNAIALAQTRFGSGKKGPRINPFKRSVSARIKTFRGSDLI